MKNIYRLVLATLFASSFATLAPVASAAEIVTFSGSAICTRDFNPWGKPSQCSCPSEARYDRRIGLCLAGAEDMITVQGEVNSNTFAIGGETTGFVVSDANQGDYELVLSFEQRDLIEQAAGQGLVYKIQGEVVNVPGVEIAVRPTILVDSIELLPVVEEDKRFETKLKIPEIEKSLYKIDVMNSINL